MVICLKLGADLHMTELMPLPLTVSCFNKIQIVCVLSPYLINILAEVMMRETLDGFQGGLQIGGRMITNLCYADDIILLATLEAEL